MAVWRWWGDGGCEAARRSATLAAASRKCEPRAAGGQSRAGAVTAAGVRWCCEGALGVGGGGGCSGRPVLSCSRDGGLVVDSFGAHGAALASAFEDSMMVWQWWGDGGREAARRAAAVAAASRKCEPLAAGGFSGHDANSRLRMMSL